MVGKIISVMAFLLGIVALPQAAFAKEPLRLKPSSQWIMQYEDDSCRLVRTFGVNKAMVLLAISRYGPGEGFRVTLAGKPVRQRSDKLKVRLQFGAYEPEQRFHYFVGTIGDMPALVGNGGYRIAPPTDVEQRLIDKWKPGADEIRLAPIDEIRYAKAAYLRVILPFGKAVHLETGTFDRPFAAMDKCIDELLTHWGIDVEKHSSLSRGTRPIGNPGRWVTSNDYPLQMVRKGQPALVQFRLSVDKHGKATACHIQKTTRPKEFDDAVCKSLMKRAKFEAALDADGNPIASYWRSTVRFQIPR